MARELGSRSLFANLESASITTRCWTLSSCAAGKRRRSFNTGALLYAGHNKWSKTKHIKAATDKKKMNERMAFTQAITMASRLYGDDVQFNPQLANAIAAATKASTPKSVIEAAIARGRGKSSTGAQLEPLTLEFLMPPNTALILDVETENRNRTLADVKAMVKKAGGTWGSTAFYFLRSGRVAFRAKPGQSLKLSDMLEEAVEHEGVEDVEELPDGDFVVWTQPASLSSVTQAFARKPELDIMASDIIWAPKEDTMVGIDTSEAIEGLEGILASLREYPDVKAIYANASKGNIPDEVWYKIDKNLGV